AAGAEAAGAEATPAARRCTRAEVEARAEAEARTEAAVSVAVVAVSVPSTGTWAAGLDVDVVGVDVLISDDGRSVAPPCHPFVHGVPHRGPPQDRLTIYRRTLARQDSFPDVDTDTRPTPLPVAPP